jgi:hypothetical protein
MRWLLVVLLGAQLARAQPVTEPSWNDWNRLGEDGDREFRARRFASAEVKYRQALTLGKSLGQERFVDAHLSSLALSLVAQGRCEDVPNEGHLLRGYLALARNEKSMAIAEFEAAKIEATPDSGSPADETACASAIVPEILGLLRWLDNQPAEARALHQQAQQHRCRALREDPIAQVATALNAAWIMGGSVRWKKALALAKESLGAQHPLVNWVTARKNNRPIRARSMCPNP